jgi:GNAT superfamily N-acetyltransferase
MPESFCIRLATPDDAEALARIVPRFTREEATPDAMCRRFDLAGARETVLVAERPEGIVGFACVQHLRSLCYARPWAELTDVYVDAAHRGQGIGTALIHRAEEISIRLGATDMVVVTGRMNLPAQNLYRTLGYRENNQMVFQKPFEDFSAGA